MSSQPHPLVPNQTYTIGSSHVHSLTAGSMGVGSINGHTFSSITIDESSELRIEGSMASKLLELYLSGKDLVTDKQEYLDVILRLPSVKGDTLKAVAVFEKLKRLSRTLCL